MYKLLLVSDKEEIRTLYERFSEWENLGFERPVVAANAQSGIEQLSRRRFDAVSSLLSISEGKQFFAYLARRPEMLGMETARDEARLRREISSARRTLSSRGTSAVGSSRRVVFGICGMRVTIFIMPNRSSFFMVHFFGSQELSR